MTPDGSRYPNVVNFVETERKYENWLPSVQLAFNVTGQQSCCGGSVSMPMTRQSERHVARPGLQHAVGGWARSAIPDLKPFLSDNIDLGIEIYTGRKVMSAQPPSGKASTDSTVLGSGDGAVSASSRSTALLSTA